MFRISSLKLNIIVAVWWTFSLMVLVTLVAVTSAYASDRSIVIVAQNSGTEVTDFLVPYGVLSRANVGEVSAVTTEEGPVFLWPGLTVEGDETIAEFDRRRPQGADIVVIPAVLDHADEALVAWLVQQGEKGALLVSICDGALILAQTGFLDGREATGHWYTADMRVDDFPDVNWNANVRYVHDGNVATSAGVSASLPISLYLVEWLAGRERAEKLAEELGVADFSTKHNSDAFFLGSSEVWVAVRNFAFGWPRDNYAIRLTEGMDEVALAFAVDMFARTYRTSATPVAVQSVQTLNGLTVIPDAREMPGAFATVGFDGGSDLHLLSGARAPVQVLRFLEERYGEDTADFVALQLEYPR